MTARERVLCSRLIQKIDRNDSYARQIGLSYTVSAVEHKNKSESVQGKEKNTRRIMNT